MRVNIDKPCKTLLTGSVTAFLCVTLATPALAQRTSLSDLEAEINQNAADISTNASGIADNASDISTNAADISTNASDIANNASDIADNASNIANNAAGISSNASDIATNSADIAGNDTEIADINADIATYAAAIANLQNVISSITKTVFVTATMYNGDLLIAAQKNFADCAGVTTGMEGADCICQETAEAAGLSGTYLAWLSTGSADDPQSRFTQATVPYVLTNFTVLADDWTDLTDGTINVPLNITENGNAAGGDTRVWTNVHINGISYKLNHCSDWTSSFPSGPIGAAGLRTQSDNDWTTSGFDVSCNSSLHLYCFEQ